jgi:hypothetical protein
LGTVTYLIVSLPIIGYAILGLGDLFTGDPLATRALAPFAMGIPVIASLLRFYGPSEDPPGANAPADASNS